MIFCELAYSVMVNDTWVGCFGFSSPLRQYFSLYRPSPKEREKEKRNDNYY